jgi:hypothetical protein
VPRACCRRVGRGCDSRAAQVVGAVSPCVQSWEARHPPPARGLDAPVELEGADAAVGWWESSVQCGETARCVMCMGEVARGVCRSIPPQSFMMLSRQGTAKRRSCFTGIIMQECSSNHQREWGASTGQYTETPHPCSRRAAALHTRLTERSYGRWWCTGTCTSDTSNVRPFSPWTFSSTRRKPLPWWLG